MLQRKWLITVLVGGMCLLMQTSSAWACPMCKMALETDDPQPRAYMTSILFMLGAVTTVFAAVAGLLVYVSRHEQRALQDAGYEHVFHNAVTVPQPDAGR